MATIIRRPAPAVGQLVFERYGRFDVFQLLRLLRWQPGAHKLRFRADLSAAFPGHEVARLHRDPKPAPGTSRTVEIHTANYCVASALGPLPEPYTEWVRELDQARAPAMRDFLDIFNQRLNLLRFDLKQRQSMALNSAAPEHTPQARYLASLMGLGQPQLADQVPLPPRYWLSLAGLLSNCRRSAATLGQVMGLYLRVPVRVQELAGAWQTIDIRDRIALGRRNTNLGRQSVLGRRVWDQQARVRLEAGPFDYASFCQLLPPNLAEQRAGSERPPHAHLIALLQLLTDRMADCELTLLVKATGVPPAKLRRKGVGLRLGHSAWLHRHHPDTAPRAVRLLVPAWPVAEAA